MRALLIFCDLAFCLSLHAASPSYNECRKSVELLCSTNLILKSERIFLSRSAPQKFAAIIHYHRGVTIREIVDQTPFKDTAVRIVVLRPKVDPWTNIINVKPKENPKFEVNALDVILIYGGDESIVW